MVSYFSSLVAAALALCGMGFYVLCLWSVRTFLRDSRKPHPDFTPPVSILKPLRGRDPQFYEAIRSHATQAYPAFEMIFGSANPDDPGEPGELREPTEAMLAVDAFDEAILDAFDVPFTSQVRLDRGKAEYIHLVTLERADSCRFQHAKAFHDWSEAKDDAAARHINATNSGWPEQQGPRP